MDGFEISEVRAPRKRRRPGEMVWNILTIVVLLVTAFIGAGFLLVYINPYSGLNPFPPPTSLPTATPTIASRITIVPTWTPTVTIAAPTQTPAPTKTPLPTSVNVESPTAVLTATLPASTVYAFIAQQGSPAAIDGSQFHPEAGCKWLGVAGEATSLNGEAVRGLFVQLGGSLSGTDSLDNLTMTGLAPQYGQGGFEITLSDTLIASDDTLWIQLLDQQNLPLSDRVYFNTYDDCNKNLVFITFEQVH
jgi:hypothetical protein